MTITELKKQNENPLELLKRIMRAELKTPPIDKHQYKNIAADCNSPTASILRSVSEVALLAQSSPGDMMTYVNPNQDRCPIGNGLMDALAEYEGVAPSNIVIAGAGYELICKLPEIFRAKTVVTTVGDFTGYKTAAKGYQHVEIQCALDGSPITEKSARVAVKDADKPIIYITAPLTNPGQNFVSTKIIDAMLDENDEAIVVIDTAYRAAAALDSQTIEDYAQYALSHDRVLSLNIAAKEFGACGARVSWLVGPSHMISLVKDQMLPYPVATASARFIGRLANRPDIVRRIHEAQRRGKKIYEDRVIELKLPMVTGAAPWVLVKIPDNKSGKLVQVMQEEFGVLIQDQTPRIPALTGWVRISVTSPDEAPLVVDALTRSLAKI